MPCLRQAAPQCMLSTDKFPVLSDAPVLHRAGAAPAAGCCSGHLNSMDLRALLLLGLCLAANLSPALSLKCYYGGGFYGGIFPFDTKPTTKDPNPACLSYQFAENGKWIYTVTNQEECAKLGALPAVYKHLKCCSVENCNAPDSTIDTTTKVIPPPPGMPQP